MPETAAPPFALDAESFRAAPVFADQPADALAWLASVAEPVAVGDGETPFRRGAPADAMMVLLEGAIQIFTWRAGQRTLFGTVHAGDVSGLLPFSRMETFQGEGTAVGTVRMARVHRSHFPELLRRMPEVGERLVAQMTDRVRESSRGEQQREKMMALGKLSAGLAHELNNPAAAIRRSVATLRERMEAMPALVSRLTGHGLTPDRVEAARAALMTCTAPVPGALSAVERAEREDALADWLDAHAVPHAYVVADVLADEGVTPDALAHLAEHVPPAALGDVVLWIEKGLAADRLLGEIESASGRIAALVAAVKGYTHMDGAPAQEPVDVHAGLDQTLTMLGHDVRAKGVRVERAYGAVPPVWAFPGELNQVWTNLLDNALDAVADGGRVEIATAREGALVCVTVADDGPDGIAPEVQERIFEPFFTTKEPGAGTGLGLDIARRIVAQHEGQIRVESRPGRTAFTVCLPVAPDARPPAGGAAG